MANIAEIYIPTFNLLAKLKEEIIVSKRALISVSDKSGILEFAKELEALDYEILSTGGTKKHLQENGVKVTSVDEVTNFP